MGNAVKLSRLLLANNQLSGGISPELGRLSNLIWLYLQANRLTGEIPPELGNLASMNNLSIQLGNEITGCMPATFRQRRATYPGGPGPFAYFRYPDFLPLCEP